MAPPAALKLRPPADALADSAASLLGALGEDLQREGLRRTPARVAKALRFLTAGNQRSPRDVLDGADFDVACEDMVVVSDIEFFSLCEHHLLPFHGRAHVAYLPAGRVLGSSTLPRLLDVYARRLQVQERLTRQLADAVDEALAPRGVAVMLEADHFCMMMRGVEKRHSRTSTFAFLGEFRNDGQPRREFLELVRGAAAPRAPAPRRLTSARRPQTPAASQPVVAKRLPAARSFGPARPPRGHRCSSCGDR